MSTSFSEYFGLSVEDFLGIKEEIFSIINDVKHEEAWRTLDLESQPTSLAIRIALLEKTQALQSWAGRAQRMMAAREKMPWLTDRERVVSFFMSDPLYFSNAAVWTMFMATLTAATEFQIHHCPTETREDRLTGSLIALWGSQCRQWAKRLDKLLKSQGHELLLHELDLSIGGGEQANGGDFGVILEFESISSIDNGQVAKHIVPLIFQAKRYQRPEADISQISAGVTPQRTLLQKNSCASAYIFYENGKKKIDRPLPALVKTAAVVGQENKTNVLADSLDLSSYLLVALADQSIGIRAPSPKEALNMIYNRASFDKLSALLVIASDGTAGLRYQHAYNSVLHQRTLDQETPKDEHEPPIKF